MRVLIYGSGAVASIMALRLSNIDGICLRGKSRSSWDAPQRAFVVKTSATRHEVVVTRAAASDRFDLVILSMKGLELDPYLRDARAHLAAEGRFLLCTNGLPTWFWQELMRNEPEGMAEDFLHGIIHFNAHREEQDIIVWNFGRGITVGSTQNAITSKDSVLSLLTAAGFDVAITEDIRRDLWHKLMGNATLNSLAALLNSEVGRMLADQELRAFAAAVMEEIKDLGYCLGLKVDLDVGGYLTNMGAVGDFVPSTLHDLRRGGPLELKNIIFAVDRLRKWKRHSMPNFEILLGMMQVRFDNHSII